MYCTKPLPFNLVTYGVLSTPADLPPLGNAALNVQASSSVEDYSFERCEAELLKLSLSIVLLVITHLQPVSAETCLQIFFRYTLTITSIAYCVDLNDDLFYCA